MGKHHRSKGGRPRKTGKRHPGGKLVQPKPTPNPRVLAERAELLGGAAGFERADHPLDLMLARKWITERQHRAGMALGRIHAQAQLGGPRMGSGDLSASAPAAVLTTHDKRAVRAWSDEELTDVFDRIFNKLPRLAGDDRMQRAQSQLNALCAALTAAERMAVLSVCTRAEWPAWLEWRVGRSALKATNDPVKIQAQTRTVAAWDRQRAHLVAGLDRIAAALFVKVKTGGKHAPEQRSFGEMNAARADLVEQRVRYETPDGEEVVATSERGVPFEVAVRRRRLA